MSTRESLPVFDSHHGRPDVWPGLTVDGLVARPTLHSAGDLIALTDRAITDDFRCEDGWSVPDQRWEGVPLRALLHLAGVSPDARYAAIAAADYITTVSLDNDDLDGVLLATRLNGATLPEQHGGPCRLVSVGQACYASVKWVDRITLTAEMPAATAQRIASARNAGERANSLSNPTPQ
jgi:DMSO/TMAO reductase YedYZ molybdopterin-dependent catalytic subunit